MSDPELAARAQRAAEMLEQSWDRWRRLHGLAAEQAQPVSSYVGYSLAEPWGQPRVVFGVGAEEAERLAALLEQDEGADPRFSQGTLWEPEPRVQPDSGATSLVRPSAPVADRTGPRWEPESGVRGGNGAAGGTSFTELSAPVADRAGQRWEPESGVQHGNGATSFAGPSAPAADHAGPQAVSTPMGSVASADLAASADSSRRAGPASDFEPPDRSLPAGGGPNLPGWTVVGSPPSAQGVLQHWS